jgi:hypothetical protein
MAGEVTVTYSERSRGWTSFWSFFPDWMLGMNSTFSTWKDGNLYEHDSNIIRNVFYYDFDEDEYYRYDSTITTIFNQDPTTNKMFKTLELESTDTWRADILTDLNSGQILTTYYDEKEGSFFAYIRNVSGSIVDNYSIGTQGIGEAALFDSLTNMITFNTIIQSTVSIGDKVYKINNGTSTLLGTVSIIDYIQLTYTPAPLGPPGPVPGDMIYIVKNTVAESYGVRGYYMEVELTNSSEAEVELFEVGSSAFKSYP